MRNAQTAWQIGTFSHFCLISVRLAGISELDTKCLFHFYLQFFETFSFRLYVIKRYAQKRLQMLVKCRLLLLCFDLKWKVPNYFRKNRQDDIL